MTRPILDLENQLNSFDAEARRAALRELIAAAEAGEITLPEQRPWFNLHCHSFFSYNGYGFSPSALAWKGRREGLCALGLIDFDVLEGVDEFLDACKLLGLRAGAGLESRVFVPDFSSRVINSPGEPGISYHMGVGFTRSSQGSQGVLTQLRPMAEARYRGMMQRVNQLLSDVALDYDNDVLPLTPKGNATERHLCAAYDAKAQAIFPEKAQRVAYWAEKLGLDGAAIANAIDDAPTFQGMIRAKTMKAGGIGYVKPEGPDFPKVDDLNEAILAAGAIPVFAFLDGASDGEQATEELLDSMMAGGVAMVNIIPDRNWNYSDPVKKAEKVEKLNAFIAAVEKRSLPIIVGTEMNAYGQRFVDDFSAPELARHHDRFLEGMHILQGHTLLQGQASMGYLSPWAQAYFESVDAKNRFFAAVGAALLLADSLEAIDDSMDAQQVADALGVTFGA